MFKEIFTEAVAPVKFTAERFNDKSHSFVLTDYRGVSNRIFIMDDGWSKLKNGEEYYTSFGNYIGIYWKKISPTKMEYIRSNLTQSSGNSMILRGDEKFSVEIKNKG